MKIFPIPQDNCRFSLSDKISKFKHENKKASYTCSWPSLTLRKNFELVQRIQDFQTKIFLIIIEKQRNSYAFAKKAKELYYKYNCNNLLYADFNNQDLIH